MFLAAVNIKSLGDIVETVPRERGIVGLGIMQFPEIPISNSCVLECS